jgi:hypothetical protein
VLSGFIPKTTIKATFCKSLQLTSCKVVDVSWSIDVLHAVVNIILAAGLTVLWQDHLNCKRERDERLKDIDELYHAWKEVEPHMIRLDLLVNHGAA